MYRLTLFDLLITIAVLILVEFPRRYKTLCRNMSQGIVCKSTQYIQTLSVFVRMVVDNSSNMLTRWVGRQEFAVPSNILGLVYGQTVVWTGALFCPLLPLINTIKFVILFYCKKVKLQHYH